MSWGISRCDVQCTYSVHNLKTSKDMLELCSEVSWHRLLPSSHSFPRQPNSCEEGRAQGVRSQRKEVWCPSRGLHRGQTRAENGFGMLSWCIYCRWQSSNISGFFPKSMQKVWAFQCGIQICRTPLRTSERKSLISTCPILTIADLSQER